MAEALTEALYDADLYALVHRGTEGDLDFYLERCKTAQSVLELACGYGRVLEALALPGRRLVGLDRDADLLSLAAERLGSRALLVRGDMRFASFACAFDRVLIPHSALYCLLEEEECVTCLAAAASLLEPGGLLLFDVYDADGYHADALAHPSDADADALEKITTVDHRGQVFDVYERFLATPVLQRLDVVYEYVPVAGGAIQLGRIPQRYWLSTQVEGIVERAGLVLRSLERRFRPGASSGEALVVTASARP